MLVTSLLCVNIASTSCPLHRICRLNGYRSLNSISKIYHAIFIESSPGPVKYAAELLGLCSSETRLPLTSIKNSTKKIVEESMREVGLL